MALYCGIDLHSNNHMVVVIDGEDRRVLERRLPNDLAVTLATLAPFKEQLEAVTVESTFNWYWLADGLQAAGYRVRLANPAAIKQYEGLKHADDRHDAFWLAHLLRLGILPTGYIYPREQRAVRDLLRRRLQLVQVRAQQLISLQSQIWRSTGVRVPSAEIRKPGFVPALNDVHEQHAARAHLAVLATLNQQIERLERAALAAVKRLPQFKLLKSIAGVGPILGLTIVLETGEISRFADAGCYSSYCRCVRSQRLSNGKRKGEGNRKAGNKYLSWAFSEAAHFCVRHEPLAKRFYERKRAKTNAIVAIRACAHKLARAAYHVMRDQVLFDAQKLFA